MGGKGAGRAARSKLPASLRGGGEVTGLWIPTLPLWVVLGNKGGKDGLESCGNEKDVWVDSVPESGGPKRLAKGSNVPIPTQGRGAKASRPFPSLNSGYIREPEGTIDKIRSREECKNGQLRGESDRRPGKVRFVSVKKKRPCQKRRKKRVPVGRVERRGFRGPPISESRRVWEKMGPGGKERERGARCRELESRLYKKSQGASGRWRKLELKGAPVGQKQQRRRKRRQSERMEYRGTGS